MTRAWRMPDFAGVALVDILANGVAMLIIVIVVSIAARVERDERHAEQADEVAAVMAHKFSTSLVLNSLAASPPAVLHDYDNSPLDQVLDPAVLPIIELHPGFVREFYSGALWPRRELLRSANRMHAWVAGLSEVQRQRLRVDVYGVGQFYLAMSILRAHGINVRHWHFLARPLSLAAARHCPPGTAAKDCIGAPAVANALPSLSGGESDDLGQPEPLLAGDGVGAGGGGDSDGDGDGPGQMPGGVVPGAAGGAGAFAAADAANADGARANRGAGGHGLGQSNSGGGQGADAAADSAAGLGSFPNADIGRPSGNGGNRAGGGQSSGDGSSKRGNAQFRIALPESIRRAAGAGDAGVPPLDAMFAAMLHYLGELQDTLDAGGSPSAQIATFAPRLQAAFNQPPKLSRAERAVARELAVHFALRGLTASADADARGALALHAADAAGEDAVVVIAPNRINQAVALAPSAAAQSGDAATRARVQIALNAYPGIWQGLDVRIEPGSVLLMPPQPRRADAMRWRAAAYIAPRLDDVIVGFVFADYDARGNLRAQADANRLRVDGRAVFSRYAESAFGARGWLVSLYAALAVGLALLALARGWLGGAARRR